MRAVPHFTKTGLHLLVVEDSRLMRERIVEQLYELDEVEDVLEAKDVAEAIEILATTRPDTVILDFNLPGGNGLDVLREVNLCKPRAGVIVFTSSNSEQVRSTCLQQGADFFVPKSADFSEVEAAIRDLALRSRPDGSGAPEPEA